MAEQTRNPTTDVALSGTFGGSAGLRYTLIDDHPDSGNVDRLGCQSNAGGWIVFGFPAFTVPSGATISAVEARYYDDKNGLGSANIGARLRIEGTDYNATTHDPINLTPTLRTDSFAVNPRTGIAWTVDDVNGASVNALEAFGFYGTDWDPDVRVQSAIIAVVYTEATTTLTFTDQPANTLGNTVMADIVVTSSNGAFAGVVTLSIGENPASGTLGGDTTKDAADGVATFDDIEINNPGADYTLLANAAGHTEVESTAFDITAGGATKLAFFVQPSEVNLDAIILPAIVVRALNSEDALDPTFQGEVTIALNDNPGGATLSGSTTVTAVNGVATFDDLSLDQAGDGYTLIASEA